MRTPVTAEFLAQFGKGDQFHVFFPEAGNRMIASITSLAIQGGELRVDFENAIELNEGGGAIQCLPNVAFYEGASISDIYLCRNENGCAMISNVPAEQIIFLVKSDSPMFFRSEAETRPT